MRAAGYGRVSSVVQVDGHSLDEQERMFRKAVEDRGDTLVAWFDDAESGTIAERPQLLEMRSRLAEFEVVYIVKLDRLARDEEVWWTFRKECDRAGVTLRSLADGEAFVGLNDSSSRTMEGIAVGQASGYSRDQSLNTRRGQAGAVEKGQSPQGRAPYGYRVQARKMAPDGRKTVRQPWLVVEHEAEVVRRIVDLYMGGMGTPSIARLLNSERVPPPMVAKWAPDRIRAILDNGIYSGVLVRGRVRKTGPQKDAPRVLQPEEEWTVVPADPELHPPILPEGKWHEVAAERKRRRAKGRRPGKQSVFAGALKCAGCGGSMNVKGWDRLDGSRAWEYQCHTFKTLGREHGCAEPSKVRELELARALHTTANAFRGAETVLSDQAPVSGFAEQREMAKRQLRALNTARRRDRTAYQRGLYDVDEFEQLTVEFRVERERLEAIRDAAPPDRAAGERELLAGFGDLLNFAHFREDPDGVSRLVGIDRDQWREFVAKYVDRIEFGGRYGEPFTFTWRLPAVAAVTGEAAAAVEALEAAS